MQAFHNDEAIKQKYLARVRKHREMDNLIQGTGWENGKGCAVGCTLENYNHSQYPIELGIPEWLARLEDRIFEGLPKDKAMLWPERFLSAIKPGDDLERVKAPFLIFVLESALETFDHEKYPNCKKAIDTVINLYKSGSTDVNEFRQARDAANAAANVYSPAASDAAYAAAYTAAFAADAANADIYVVAAASAASASASDAAYNAAAYAASASAYNAAAYTFAAFAAAYAAAYAAYNAANAAVFSAANAARRNVYVRLADKIIEILER